MPKNGFPMPTAKNRFQILNLHPKKHVFKKNIVLKGKKITVFFAVQSESEIRFLRSNL